MEVSGGVNASGAAAFKVLMLSEMYFTHRLAWWFASFALIRAGNMVASTTQLTDTYQVPSVLRPWKVYQKSAAANGETSCRNAVRNATPASWGVSIYCARAWMACAAGKTGMY